MVPDGAVKLKKHETAEKKRMRGVSGKTNLADGRTRAAPRPRRRGESGRDS